MRCYRSKVRKCQNPLSTFTVRDLDQGYAGEVIRFVFLSTHYGKPMDWTDAKAKEAEKTLRKWREWLPIMRRAQCLTILDTLGDDLNTAGVIAELHNWQRVMLRGCVREPASWITDT